MNKTLKITLTLFFSLVVAQTQAARPTLEETALFTETVKNCLEVEPNNWNHPTNSYLEKKEGVEIVWIKLCNSGEYPVFGVNFKYAPGGSTKNYFTPLYFDVFAANKSLPFAFVALIDQTVIEIKTGSGGDTPTISEHHEFYAK